MINDVTSLQMRDMSSVLLLGHRKCYMGIFLVMKLKKEAREAIVTLRAKGPIFMQHFLIKVLGSVCLGGRKLIETTSTEKLGYKEKSFVLAVLCFCVCSDSKVSIGGKSSPEANRFGTRE